MSEEEFIEQIDCRFPYRAPIRWRRLSAQAARISPNAAFMVVHEVCRPPRSVQLLERHASAILRHLRRRFRHPLLRVVQPAVQAHISGRLLHQSRAAALMQKVATFRNQYNALAVCYMSANDRSGLLDRTYNQVVQEWADS